MNEPDFKVLVDLSFASLGYAGIPQEARLIFRMMNQLSGTAATGLIFGMKDAVITHRFPSKHTQARKEENHALFMQALVSGHMPLSRFRPLRWYQHLKAIVRTYLGRTVQVSRLDNDMLWDTVWRNLLAKSLPDDDIELSKCSRLLLANLGAGIMKARAVSHLPPPRLDTREFEFALFHDAQHVRVSPNTFKLIRYQDLIPGLRPDLVGSRMEIKRHFCAIRRCLQDSVFVCNSQTTRLDLLRAFPELTERAVVIPCVLSDSYYPDKMPRLVSSILLSRPCEAAAKPPSSAVRPFLDTDDMPPYLIMVSTIEPRKNHVGLIRAFKTLIAREHTDVRLVIVGSPGWKCREALAEMAPLIAQGRLFHLERVPHQEMRVLYTHAAATIFPSLYEGFGYSPLEAMLCQTPAIVSDIAAHRWVYGDSVLYCDPYRVDSITEAMRQLLFSGNATLREELIHKGEKRARRYGSGIVGNQWLKLFAELRRQGGQGDVRNLRLAQFDEPVQERLAFGAERLLKIHSFPGQEVG